MCTPGYNHRSCQYTLGVSLRVCTIADAETTGRTAVLSLVKTEINCTWNHACGLVVAIVGSTAGRSCVCRVMVLLADLQQ